MEISKSEENEIIAKALSSITALRKATSDFDYNDIEQVIGKLQAIAEEKREAYEAEKREAEKQEALRQSVIEHAKQIGFDLSLLADVASTEKTKKNKKAAAAPKYRFPNEKGEDQEWAGRGRTPLPLAKLLDEGFSLDDFLIEKPDQQSE